MSDTPPFSYRDTASAADPIRIVINMPTPSLNETQRMHWAKLKRLADSWFLQLSIAATTRPGCIWWPASGKRQVTIERRGKRELDRDNLYGGCKIVIDSLKKHRIIKDDDAANLDLEVIQTKCKRGEKPKTIITVTDPSVSDMFPIGP